jgi:hypothetical protein
MKGINGIRITSIGLAKSPAQPLDFAKLLNQSREAEKEEKMKENRPVPRFYLGIVFLNLEKLGVYA